MIYISGPMTGLPDYNYPTFHRVAAELRALGYTVVNPAEIEVPDASWSDYLRADIKALMDCEFVATLPGWEKSKGARLEVHIARELGMSVVSVDELLKQSDLDRKRSTLRRFGWETDEMSEQDIEQTFECLRKSYAYQSEQLAEQLKASTKAFFEPMRKALRKHIGKEEL